MKNKVKKIFYVTITALVVFSLLTIPCSAATGFTRTPLRGQETDYWCWCASNQMQLETQGRYFTQTQIANNIHRGATVAEQVERLQACAPDIQWDVHYFVYSFEKVKNAINLGWAISILSYNSSDGHSMIITGYDQNSAGYNNIWLQDPWDNNDSPHTGVEGWCNYYAPVHGNYANTVFGNWQNYIWEITIV